jgi:hypothetical protein
VAVLGVGLALILLERFEEALPCLHHAVMLRPNCPKVQFYLVVVLSHLGRIKKARAALSKLEEKAALRGLIDTYMDAGEWSESCLSALRRLGARLDDPAILDIPS